MKILSYENTSGAKRDIARFLSANGADVPERRSESVEEQNGRQQPPLNLQEGMRYLMLGVEEGHGEVAFVRGELEWIAGYALKQFL